MRNSPGSEVRGGARRLRLIRLAAIVAVMSVGAGGLLFFAVSGWPDVPGQAIADAESVKQERSTEQDRAREDQGSASSMPAAGADTTEPALSFANSVVKQADAWNIRTCLSQVTRISDFLTSGHSYTALSQRILRDAGEGAFSATIVARDRSGLDSISTLVSVPVGGEDCHAAYQTVAAFPEQCEQVQSKYFSAFAERLAFGDRVQASHNGQGSYVYFLPFANTGCIIVKTQMFD